MGDEFPNATSSILLSLLQQSTILTILSLFNIEYFIPEPPSKLYYLPFAFVFYAVNWYRYERKRDSDRILNKWEGEDENKSRTNAVLIMAYFVITVLLIVLM